MPVRTVEPAGPKLHDPDVALAAGGDVHAFERLYRTHVARVYTLGRRMLGPTLAEDVTQEVFVRVWQRLHTFRGESSFSTWLRKVALNVALTRRAELLRDRERLQGGDDLIDKIAGRMHSPDQGLDFERALELLPEGARTVLVLFDVEGHRHEEIAGLLGIAVGTSKAQLHRARMLMRSHLES